MGARNGTLCEHLASACAQLCDALLRACPGLKFLATSREALHLAGEVVWLVPSLSLPDPEQLPAVPELAEYAAVRLFVERSKAVRASFDPTSANAGLWRSCAFTSTASRWRLSWRPRG